MKQELDDSIIEWLKKINLNKKETQTIETLLSQIDNYQFDIETDDKTKAKN